MHLIKSCLKTRKRRKYGNKRNSYINIHLKDRLDRIHSFLRWADARGSADIIYRVWRISLVCGSSIVIEVYQQLWQNDKDKDLKLVLKESLTTRTNLIVDASKPIKGDLGTACNPSTGCSSPENVCVAVQWAPACVVISEHLITDIIALCLLTSFADTAVSMASRSHVGLYIYTVSQKTGPLLFFTVTLANAGRFLKFFHYRNHKLMTHNKN